METAFNNMFSHIKYRLEDGDFWQSNAVISDLKIAKGYFYFSCMMWSSTTLLLLLEDCIGLLMRNIS